MSRSHNEPHWDNYAFLLVHQLSELISKNRADSLLAQQHLY